MKKLYKNNEIIINEIFYFYTKNGERENEEGTSKYIYKKKTIKNEVYSFGVNFKKDTISSNQEPIVVIKSWFYDNFTTDTVYSNTIKPQSTKKDSIIKLTIDSFGEIIEKRLYFPAAHCVNDVVLSEDSRTSQKLIKYDKDGNEELNELFNSKGLLIETIKYNYNRNHLLLFIEEIYPKSRKEMKNKVWVYIYKYYN